MFRRRPHRRTTAYEGVLGTSLDLVIVAGSEAVASRAEQRILGEIDRLDPIFSTYRPSEFQAFQETSHRWVEVSDDLAYVLERAEHWRARSNGAFLPTVEALRLAWERGKELRLDPQEPLWEVEGNRAKRLTDLPATLNSIAKGYIIDRATEAAMAIEGVKQVVVNIGGDIRHAGEGMVRAQITNPFRDGENAAPAAVVQFSNGGIASSGGYRRQIGVLGGVGSHLIDPMAQRTAEGVASCSAVAESAMTADVLATILAVLPVPTAFRLVYTEPNAAGFVITPSNEYLCDSRWRAMLVETLKSPKSIQNNELP